jgi:hypothetical protein
VTARSLRTRTGGASTRFLVFRALRVWRGGRPRAAATATLALLALAALADAVTGPDLSPLLFYGVAVVMAGRGVGRLPAMVAALAGALCSLAVGLAEVAPDGYGVVTGNAAMRLGALAVIAAVAPRDRRRRPTPLGRPRGEDVFAAAEAAYERAASTGAPFTIGYLYVAALPGGGGAAAAAEFAVAGLLPAVRGVLRASDHVAGLRGRECVLLLDGVHGDAAHRALRRIGAAVELAARVVADDAYLGAVGGVTCAGPLPGGLDQALQRAYQLMYEAGRVPGRVSIRHETLATAEPAVPA